MLSDKFISFEIRPLLEQSVSAFALLELRTKIFFCSQMSWLLIKFFVHFTRILDWQVNILWDFWVPVNFQGSQLDWQLTSGKVPERYNSLMDAGVQGTCPRSIFSFSGSFWEKNDQNYRLMPLLLGWNSLLWEIRDPPLQLFKKTMFLFQKI